VEGMVVPRKGCPVMKSGIFRRNGAQEKGVFWPGLVGGAHQSQKGIPRKLRLFHSIGGTAISPPSLRVQPQLVGVCV